MIYTSYFGMLQRKSMRDRNFQTLCVARGHRYYYGECLPQLYPTWEMIKMEDQEEYEKVYREQVLSKLDALEVWEELNSYGDNVVLLCHEKYSDIEDGKTFCHRHMIARWLEEELWLKHNMDVTIPELKDDKEDLKKVLKKSKQMDGQLKLF